MKYLINSDNIADLDIAFSRGLDLLGDSIALCRGGWKAVRDKSFPTHAFFFCRIRDQLFAFEETPQGLRPMALSEYNTARNRIISVYRCKCWDELDRKYLAIDYLIGIMAEGGERQQYGWKTLFSKLPVIGRFIPPDKVADICSENVSEVLYKFGGVDWFRKTGTKIAPDELQIILHAARRKGEANAVLGYYKD